MDRVDEGAQTTAVSFVVNGAAGAGYVELADQAAPPANTATRLYARSNHLTWQESGGQPVAIDSSALTAARSFTLPDASGAMATTNAAQTFTNKTILGSGGNTVDATMIGGIPLSGAPAAGDTLTYTGANWSPLTLSATAPLSYSAGAFSATVGTTAGTLAAGNDNRFATPQVVQVKPSLAGAGQFTSIASALASITDSTALKPYVVAIAPGIYTETPLTLPQYVTLAGSGPAATYIKTTTPGVTMITYGVGCSVRDCTILGAGGAGSIAALADSVGTIYITRAVISGFEQHILVRAVTSTCAMRVIEVNSVGTFTNALHVDGRAITGTNPVSASVTVFVVAGAAGAAAGVLVEGPYATLTLANSNIAGLTTGSGILTNDGAVNTITATRTTGNLYGINCANVGAGQSINCETVAAISNTNDILIDNPAATGSFTGLADITKVVINATGNFPLSFVDSQSQSNAILGDFIFQPTQAANAAEIGDLWTYTAALGKYTGGVISAGVGLAVTVAAGEGYVAHGSFPTQHLFKCIWASTPLALAASTTYYIYADEFGINTTGSLPNPTTQILLGRVRTTASGIEFIDSQNNSDYHPVDAVRNTFRYAIGALYANGSIVTANASRELAISSGSYYYLNNQYAPSGQVSPANFYAYFHTAGVFTRAAATIVDNAQYDNGTALTPIPAGLFVKHSLYIVGEGATEQYFLVYGQTTYASLLAAQQGANPTPPSYFSEGIFLIASPIVQQGVAALADIIDNRPTLGAAGASFAGVTDHGNLTGLLDDDHPQYLLVDGTRAMAGTLNMGGNPITTAGAINGVTIAAHASRHLPNGADPITTAAPLTTLSAATTNATGTANSFARSDHTHAVDVAGFGINTLSGTLGVAKGGTGVTTLAPNTFLSANGAGAVVTTFATPSSAVVGISDTQTLTNKTATASTNNITARAIFVGSGAGSVSTFAAVAPTAGQVLTATSASTATWQAPGAALIDTTTFIIDATFATRRLGFDIANTINGSDLILRTNLTAAGTSTADIPNFTGTDTFVMANLAQTLVGKTLTAPTIASLQNGGTITIPAGTYTLAGDTTATTFTNKDLLSATNNVAANRLNTTGAAVVVNTAAPPTVGQSLVATSATAAAWQTLSSTLVDTATFIVDAVTPTTRIGFDAAGGANTTLVLQSSTTANRTITFPDATDTVVVVGTAQTLTNKTITDSTSTVYTRGIWTSTGTVLTTATAPTVGQTLRATSGTAATWQNPASGLIDTQVSIVDSVDATKTLLFDVAGGSGTSTTLTTSQAANAVLTLPAATCAIVGDTSTNTLMNKTITSATNTVYAAGFITAGAAVTYGAAAAPAGSGYTLVTTSATAATWQLAGNVSGPGSSTTNAITRFADTTGKLLKDSPSFILNDAGDLATLNTIRLTTGLKGSAGNAVLGLTDVASAVNYLTASSAIMANNPKLSAAGSDATIGVDIVPKAPALSDSYIKFYSSGNTAVGMQIQLSSVLNSLCTMSFVADAAQTYTFPDATGDVLLSTAAQNVSAKIFDSTNVFAAGAGTLKFTPAGTAQLNVTTAQTSTQSVAIPNVAGGDSIVTNNTTATLTNKTLATGTTRIQGPSGGYFAFSTVNTSGVNLTITNANIVAASVSIPTTTGDAFLLEQTIQVVRNKSIDSTNFIVDAANNTKKLGFNLAGMTASRTLTVTSAQTTNQSIAIPNVGAGDSFATVNSSATLTNKIITDSSNNVAANSLKTATTNVAVASATAPTAGQALVATSSTNAIWGWASNRINKVTSASFAFVAAPTTSTSISVTAAAAGEEYLIIVSCGLNSSVAGAIFTVNLNQTAPAATSFAMCAFPASSTTAIHPLSRTISFTTVAAGLHTFNVSFSINGGATGTASNFYFAMNYA